MTRAVHTDTKEGIKLFRDLKAKWMIPVHHSTFYEDKEDGFSEVKKTISGSELKDKIILLDFGKSVEFKNPGMKIVNSE